MKCEKEKITPALAREMLGHTPDFQRKLDLQQGQKILLAIMRNEWRENGATIVLNASGELVDGQHRCWAIAESGRTVYSLVVRGVPSGKETFVTIDDAKARTVRDFLSCKNAVVISGVAAHYWYTLNGSLHNRNARAPIADVLKMIEPWLSLLQDICNEITPSAAILKSKSFPAFLLLYYRHVAPVAQQDRLTEFFKRVADGIGLQQGDPTLTLRNRLTATGKNDRIVPGIVWDLIIKALHAHLDGRSLHKLSMDTAKEEHQKLRGSLKE